MEPISEATQLRIARIAAHLHPQAPQVQSPIAKSAAARKKN